jgi:RecA/RadA recombinase
MNNVIKIKVGEVKHLLEQGKKIKVKTLNGEFTNIKAFVDKGQLETFEVVLANDMSIKVSAAHRFMTESGWKMTSELNTQADKLLTEDGFVLIKSISSIGLERIVDISVEHEEECYFGNGILNHNTGKSFLAAQIAGKAQKQGITAVYFDAESALNSEFLTKAGCNLEDLIYIQPTDLETVFETMETLMGATEQKFIFIIDSLAATPTKVDIEGTFNPTERIGVKAALLAKAFQKITTPLAQRECTLILLNQLKVNIKATSEAPAGGKYLTDSQKYNTPGGSSPDFFTSVRIWLTKSFAKDSMVYDEKGYQIGSYVKARIEKSRFGTQNRVAEFKMLWGDTVGVMNEESILEAIKGKTEHLETGAWNKLTYADGTVEKWQGLEEGFTNLMKTNEKFHARVMEIFDYEVIQKFDKKLGNAKDFLNDGAGEAVQH